MGHEGINPFRIFSECQLCARQCTSTRDIIISTDTSVCLDLYFCVHTCVFTVVDKHIRVCVWSAFPYVYLQVCVFCVHEYNSVPKCVGKYDSTVLGWTTWVLILAPVLISHVAVGNLQSGVPQFSYLSNGDNVCCPLSGML